MKAYEAPEMAVYAVEARGVVCDSGQDGFNASGIKQGKNNWWNDED